MATKAVTEKRGFWHWLDERLGLDGLRYPMPKYANNIFYALGGTTLIIFAVLIITGIIMTQFYNSSPEKAYQSVQYIMTQVTGGKLLRNLHYWLANAALLVVILHMIRVFFTASYKKPRELNWIIGLILFTITGLFFYTGSVLKRDQEGFEALEHMKETGELFGKVGTFLTEGFSKTVESLGRVYAAHIAILPIFLLLFIAVHLLLIKRFGISPLPFGSRQEIENTYEREKKVPFTTHIAHFSVYGLIFLIIAIVLSLFSSAPLGMMPVEGIEVTKPSWPFIWLVPLEARFGVIAISIAFGLLLLGLALWLFIERTRELDPRRRKFAMTTLAIVIIAWIALTIYGYIIPTGHLE
ncbi:MAG: cytochrome b N-terminal domain-containing protein [Actinobacteria bacterium]|nr:cytochrome b N-terminal domain-containing protein [Actinomycetota bacterium]